MSGSGSGSGSISVSPYEYVYKIIILGDSGVGKTSIIERFIKKKFTYDSVTTIGVDFETTMVQVLDEFNNIVNIKLHIWDTAGQEAYQALTRIYYRTGVAALAVFDVSNRKSFVSVEKWIKKLHENGPQISEIILVGNKVDKSREVTEEEAMSFARKHGISYIETSAKTGDHVEHVFYKLAQEIYNRFPHAIAQKYETAGILVNLKTPDTKSYAGWFSAC